MLKEGSAPMTTYKTGAETVLLGREMGGDEGKDIQRDAVYMNEGVPPLADSRQRGRGILVELRNLIDGETTEEVSVSFP
jgi:hypothetical protein